MDAELDARIKKVADWCLGNGISVLPIGSDKKPAIAWGPLIDEPLKEWCFPGCNLGLITGETNGVSVIDCDSMESAIWWRKNRPHTPMMVRSRRGVHYFYKHPAGAYIKSDAGIVVDGDIKVDAKCSRSYVLFAPSYRSGHQYSIIINDENPYGAWISPDMLPEFDIAWRPERPIKEWNETEGISNMRAYLSKCFAVEGNSGDKDTYRLCCILKDHDFSETDALALMCEWNETNATPKWSVEALRRKIRSAFS